jgi:putative transposase
VNTSGEERLQRTLQDDDGTSYHLKTIVSNQKWAGEGRLYLAVMIDLFSRQVVGWSMAESMIAELVCDALQMAVFKRKRPKRVMVHSDRGSQYCSHAYRQLLQQHLLLANMSAKEDCYDNAYA